MSSLKDLLAEGQVQRAVEEANQRLRKDINDPEALVTLAKVALLEGDFARTETLLQQASVKGPSEEVVLVRASLALQRQDWERARVIYQSLASKPSARPEVFYGLGLALNRLNKPEAAREPLERAVALEPTVLAYHFELGRTGVALNQPRLAARQFVLCLRLDKRDARAWRFLVELARVRGKPRTAERLLALGLEQVPEAEVLRELLQPQEEEGPHAALVRQAIGLMENNRGRDALKLVREAQAQGARGLSLKLLEARASESLATPDVEGTIRAYEEARAEYPEAWQPSSDLGLFLLRQGHRHAARAIEVLEEARRRAPERPEPRFNLALALSRNARAEEGAALARALMADLPPEHPFHGHARELLASLGQS